MSWDEFQEYVPVAERRKQAAKRAKKLAKGGEDLQPVEAAARGIATTFWGRAWCRNLEHYADYETRLPRGRSYLRNGQVIDLRIEPGLVSAKVLGSELYDLRVRIEPLPAKIWRRIRKQCAGGIASTIDLLQGKLSDDVMKIMTEPGEGLFPTPAEIRFDCSCPDWAELCKHAAAALYGVGVRLDQSPDLLFTLRGVDHAELIASAANAAVEHARTAAQSDTGGLAGEDLSAVFGIEIAPATEATAAPPPVRRRGKA